MKRASIAGLISAALLVATPVMAQYAVRGGVVYTMEGAPIRDGVVVVTDGKIAAVGPAADINVPAGYRTLEAAVITPGFIDGRTVVGLAGYLNQNDDQDQLEKSAPIQPELRAIDAYNPREELVQWVREHGVTTMHTGHGPGAVVSGQTMIVKTRGNTASEALLEPRTMLAVTLGPSAYMSGNKAPGTRAKEVAMLRSELIKAQEYTRKLAGPADKRPDRDLRLDALAEVLRGELPLLVTANRAIDIMTALRLADEFDIEVVLDGAAEVYTVLDHVKAAGVPVLLHGPMARTYGDSENASWETGARLKAAGIPFAYQSGYESYVPKTRVLLFEAAIGAVNGLGIENALEAITISPARILGIDERVGSIRTGKDADLVLFDGEPFEYTSHVTAVMLDGELVSETVR